MGVEVFAEVAVGAVPEVAVFCVGGEALFFHAEGGEDFEVIGPDGAGGVPP